MPKTMGIKKIYFYDKVPTIKSKTIYGDFLISAGSALMRDKVAKVAYCVALAAS